MISIDGVELNVNMVWEDRYQSKRVVSSMKRTLGGKPIIFNGTITSGFKISLVAGESFGWLSRDTVKEMIDRANIAGASYVLVFGLEAYTVMFDNTEGPAVAMTPLVARTEDAATDWMIGQIKLIIL